MRVDPVSLLIPALGRAGTGCRFIGLLILVAGMAACSGESPRSELPELGKVEGFELTNQEGEAVSLENLEGRVWVADVIFTRCPGPCEQMSRQMKSLQEALPADSPVRLLSVTTDPGYDTPDVLKDYGDRLEADPDQWWFLTGPKEEILALVVDQLKLAAEEIPPGEREQPNDRFVHSTKWVLVDSNARIRGYYDGTSPEGREQVLQAIERLLEAA